MLPTTSGAESQLATEDRRRAPKGQSAPEGGVLPVKAARQQLVKAVTRLLSNIS